VSFVVDDVAVFLRVLLFIPCQYHSTSVPMLIFIYMFLLPKNKPTKTGNLPLSNAVLEIEGSLGRKVVSLLLFFKGF
jgi:hypothetical protein